MCAFLWRCEMSGCPDCGDEFHLDDTGGYNPPCPCGCGCCRSCHDANASEDLEWGSGDENEDWQDEEVPLPPTPHQHPK